MIAQRAYDPWGGHDLSARPSIAGTGLDFSGMPAREAGGGLTPAAGAGDARDAARLVAPSGPPAAGATPFLSESGADLLPRDRRDPAGLRAAHANDRADAVHGAPSSPAGSTTFTVTMGDDALVILRMLAAALRVDDGEAIGRAVCFYAEHGLGIPALARGDLTNLPDFDRAEVARPARRETRGPP